MYIIGVDRRRYNSIPAAAVAAAPETARIRGATLTAPWDCPRRRIAVKTDRSRRPHLDSRDPSNASRRRRVDRAAALPERPKSLILSVGPTAICRYREKNWEETAMTSISESTRAASTDSPRVTYALGSEPRALLPGLEGFYAKVVPLSWPILRFAAGWFFLVRGYLKVMAGPAKVAPAFTAMGFTDPMPLVLTSTYLEGIGGLCLILGLFTRFWAAALAIELGYITFFLYWGNGYSWLARGYEYTFVWGLMCFAIALRGGGPYSLDRLFRKEL
jgi:putative oxidoreductase